MASAANSQLKIASFNMRGYNQGHSAILELIENNSPDIILIQEHWLTPANLYKLDAFDGYFAFGSSAMGHLVETGILYGRPFGGVAILVKNELRHCVQTIHCAERYAIILVKNLLVVSVYFPCSGTADRLTLCRDLLSDVCSWLEQYRDYEWVIAGDFNVDFNTTSNLVDVMNEFCSRYKLVRCDKIFNVSCPTYINDALNQRSTIDYILLSAHQHATDFQVVDLDVNFSDHLPLLCSLKLAPFTHKDSNKIDENSGNSTVTHLRWDHADLVSYYHYTGLYLHPIFEQLNNVDNQPHIKSSTELNMLINEIHDNIVIVLNNAANMYVPRHHKSYYKYWWDEEMDALKDASIESNRIWKAAGKPRHGTIFEKRQRCRLQYRKRIRDSEKMAISSYSNDLHEALLKKNGTLFWKCWNSKFNTNRKCEEVDGCTDPVVIADKFNRYFSELYVCNNESRANALRDEYEQLRLNYCGLPFTEDYLPDIEIC